MSTRSKASKKSVISDIFIRYAYAAILSIRFNDPENSTTRYPTNNHESYDTVTKPRDGSGIIPTEKIFVKCSDLESVIKALFTFCVDEVISLKLENDDTIVRLLLDGSGSQDDFVALIEEKESDAIIVVMRQLFVKYIDKYGPALTKECDAQEQIKSSIKQIILSSEMTGGDSLRLKLADIVSDICVDFLKPFAYLVAQYQWQSKMQLKEPHLRGILAMAGFEYNPINYIAITLERERDHRNKPKDAPKDAPKDENPPAGEVKQ